MRVVFAALAFLLAGAFSNFSPAAQKGFELIAQQAEAARLGDRIPEAIHLYRAGVDLRPTWSDGWWWLGSLYYDQDRFPEAAAAFRRFVAMAPRPGPAYAFLGLCEYETRDYSSALDHFQKWALAGSPGTDVLIDVASFHWALLLTREGRFVQALYLLEAKVQKLGISPGLTEGMGLPSLRMAQLPEDYPPERREMVWLAGEAAAYASLHDPEYGRANEYAGKLLLHYSQEPNVHYFRGTLFGFENKREEAREEYRQELLISPRHVSAMLELVRLDFKAGQLDEAGSLAKQATEIEPNNPVTHREWGRVLLAGGRFQEGARELETAKQLAPDNASIRFQLATAYRKLGRNEEAEREFAVFGSLKNKPEALISPEEKEELLREEPGQPK
jgi:tetratricopeptide (TPR) repeat protein